MDEKAVIIACDFSSKEKLVKFLDQIEDADPNFYCKVGMELFYTGALNGFNPVEMIKQRGHKVFLDLKLKDIPNTVGKTAKVLATAGADIINVHADGGFKMMKKAVDSINAVYDEYENAYKYACTKDVLLPDVQEEISELKQKISSRPILLGVTVLTSMSQEELEKEIGVKKTPREQAVSLALLCKEAGMDGVICSPEEILPIKKACGEDFLTITPGIRFIDSMEDDQTRIATPYCANEMGTNAIVVGRPITDAADSVKAYERCKEEFVEGIGSKEEIENAKVYISNIRDKMLEPADAVALALIEAGAFKVNTEDPYLL
ncbi:MAG: orotidine 5'-phosphate decarboxylase, partial [Bacilli bacterium]|nr:orotidine 5'-phosphate decarboxylase [Bacilli bacterium]